MKKERNGDGSPIRSVTCNHCSHKYDSETKPNGIPTTCRCRITGRKGSVERGKYCLQFVNRLSETETQIEFNGFKVRSKQVEDYRTKNQWEKAGYRVKQNAIGTEMYPVMLAAQRNGRRYTYYLPNEVE